MNDIDFKNGFLCGMIATGLPIGGGGGVQLPSVDKLDICNIDYYADSYGCGRSKLTTSYTTVLSNISMPKSGYVIIGGWDLSDNECDESESSPEADICITVDDEIIYEGDVIEYFGDSFTLRPPKVFYYGSNFKIECKRRNMTDAMEVTLKLTKVVGLK